MREASHLLIPVKSLRLGKGRLAPALNAAERLHLNRYLLRRTLSIAASFPGLDRTVVVSDADDTLSQALSHGGITIRSKHASLNAAVAEGRDALLRRGISRIIVLPVDLPLLESDDVREIDQLSDDPSVIICPNHNGTGTNAIAISGTLPLAFRFGADSYRAHQEEVRASGIEPLLHCNQRIAQDIDLPADLDLLKAVPI